MKKANTRVVGISVDSRHCHLHWAADLGGISFPLLADFHPKGAVGKNYGVYLEDAGFDDRATVIVDCAGVVRHAHSVTPKGQRDINELFERAREVSQGAAPSREPAPPPPPLAADATLYVRPGCRFCASVLRAVQNLHCERALKIRDITNDPEALKDLERLVGMGSKVPALVQNGKVQHESGAIIGTLAAACNR